MWQLIPGFVPTASPARTPRGSWCVLTPVGRHDLWLPGRLAATWKTGQLVPWLPEGAMASDPGGSMAAARVEDRETDEDTGASKAHGPRPQSRDWS